MRIVFMGTPDFAVPSLRALLDNGYQVVGVFCQPDRPKGRGHKLAACPVRKRLSRRGFPSFSRSASSARKGRRRSKASRPICA